MSRGHATGWNDSKTDTVLGVLSRAASRHPERAYFDFTGETYTYGQIDALSTSLARGLVALGVKPGDTVVSMLDNNVDAVLSWYAINKAGAISVPLNTALKGEFLRHQISDAGASIVLAEADYAERVAGLLDVLTNVRTVVHRGGAAGAVLAASRAAVVRFESLHGNSGTQLPAAPAPRDLTMLIYTSGTTGPSKGCMISHNYACNLARQAAESAGHTERDCIWTALPLFHMNATATTVLATALIGARAAIYPRFSLSNFWPEIERTGATFASLLGSMIALIAQAEDTPESKRCHGQLRAVGGQPFPQAMQEAWKKRFGVQHAGTPGYGLTEASLMTSLPYGEYSKPGTSGKRNEDFEILIVDDEDNEVPPGTPGEVICRPKRPLVMFEGYWRRPTETLSVMRNLWLHSGDIGKFDEEGFFYFLDRKKDYLRRRGENISSYELEATFLKHPAIADVAVHAVPAKVGEDDVKVTAVLKPGAQLAEEDLCRWSLERLPYYAVPLYIEFRSDLPRNPTGKVLKYQLRDEGVTPKTWDRERAGIEIKKR